MGGVLVAAVLLVVVLVGAGAWFFTRHVELKEATPASAANELDEVRLRFAGQAPLIDPDAQGRAAIAELERRRATYNGPLPDTFRIVVWDKREQQVARLSLPFWMLRLQSSDSLRLDLDGIDLGRLGVTVEDLRLAGPALVLLHEDESSRLIVWTE